MGPSETQVKACPRCKRAVEAKDYMPGYIGKIGAFLTKIYCRCGYRGLPIEMSLADYRKWRASS